ncbi:ketosteroid isomerase-like protein [Bradyrhizobium sp. USDA 4461]
MSFDPMAAAVDWLDAYRACDVETILRMYADDAVINCHCGGSKTIAGREALRAYWIDRLKRCRAFELDNLE